MRSSRSSVFGQRLQARRQRVPKAHWLSGRPRAFMKPRVADPRVDASPASPTARRPTARSRPLRDCRDDARLVVHRTARRAGPGRRSRRRPGALTAPLDAQESGYVTSNPRSSRPSPSSPLGHAPTRQLVHAPTPPVSVGVAAMLPPVVPGDCPCRDCLLPRHRPDRSPFGRPCRSRALPWTGDTAAGRSAGPHRSRVHVGSGTYSAIRSWL